MVLQSGLPQIEYCRIHEDPHTQYYLNYVLFQLATSKCFAIIYLANRFSAALISIPLSCKLLSSPQRHNTP